MLFGSITDIFKLCRGFVCTLFPSFCGFVHRLCVIIGMFEVNTPTYWILRLKDLIYFSFEEIFFPIHYCAVMHKQLNRKCNGWQREVQHIMSVQLSREGQLWAMTYEYIPTCLRNPNRYSVDPLVLPPKSFTQWDFICQVWNLWQSTNTSGCKM